MDGAGEIVDPEGKVVGTHDAYWRFTVGQRKGLGIALGYPAFVTHVDADTKRVHLGRADELMHPALMAHRCNWFLPPKPDQIVGARIRHRGPILPCRVIPAGDDQVLVQFLEPARAISPGQAVVIYDGDVVLGGGWIQHAVEEA